LDISNLGRQLKLDIGVDLKGHTTDCRPKIFAFGVAPIQISYLGFPGTLGDKNLDYIIGDKFVTPFEDSEFFTEKIIQMPHSYQVNDNTKKISRKKITRQEAGLPQDSFVFSCFNNNYKIGPDEFDVWCRILKRVPKSVLWLFESNKIASKYLKEEAKKRGVSPNRLIFADRKPLSEHLARHKLADLTLDTFNYNAHTTGSDSLWIGVPIVTKIGKSFPARVGASLVSAVGLEELITHNVEDYENLAVELAKNKKRLTKIKANLTKNKAKKGLFNTEQFAKDLENCYIDVIKNH
jgi:predicted O-linked N-acetylglucosamine transferase (SPINDLY family)